MSRSGPVYVLRQPEIERFRARIGSPTPDGCQLWTGAKNNKGYGTFTLYRDNGPRRIFAHRINLALALGRELTANALHSCDVPLCAAPEHLREGTQADNARDAIDRGRADLSGLDMLRQARRAAAESAAAVVAETGLKRCHSCAVVKPVGAYRRRARSYDGLNHHCSACILGRGYAR